jgi:hypothetical protein
MKVEQTTPIVRDPAHLQEALPWYQNGTLADADRAWVEQMLAEGAAGDSEDAHRQLEFDRRLTAVFEQKLAEVPADIGWARLMQQVRADAAPQLAADGMKGRAAQGAGATGSGGFAGGIAGGSGGGWLQRFASLFSPTASPGLGLAMAAVLVAQTVAIGVLLNQREPGAPDTVEYRSGAGAQPIAVIRALLNETITEKALREALSSRGASIVDGPNPLGEYWIATGGVDPDAVAASLREAGVIASYVIDQRQQQGR